MSWKSSYIKKYIYPCTLVIVVIPVTVFTEVAEVLLALASCCTSWREGPPRDTHFRIQKSSLPADASSTLVLPGWAEPAAWCQQCPSCRCCWPGTGWKELVSANTHMKRRMHLWNKEWGDLSPKHREPGGSCCLSHVSSFYSLECCWR